MEKEILNLISDLAYTCSILVEELQKKLDYDSFLSWHYKNFIKIWEISLDMQRNVNKINIKN